MDDQHNESSTFDRELSLFLGDKKTQLSILQGGNMFDAKMWVFQARSVEVVVPDSRVQEKIKSVFCNFHQVSCYRWMVAQFWAPMEDDHHVFLSTSDQPFAVGRLDRRYMEYRNKCVGYEYVVSSGPPGRVFLNRFPESTPDIKYYSDDEYPLLSSALECDLKCYYAFPVFDVSDQRCLGVIELLTSCGLNLPPVDVLDEVNRMLETVNLTSFNPKEYMEKEVNCRGIPASDMKHVKDEINRLLEIVCRKKEISFAQAWISFEQKCLEKKDDGTKAKVNGFDSSYTKEMIALKLLEHCEDRLPSFYFRQACNLQPLRNGEGVVGKATNGTCFCEDISQLRITGYPFAHYASHNKLSSCFSICIRSSHMSNIDYILEFFLSSKTCVRTSGSLLDSVLAMIKVDFGIFVAVKREEVGAGFFDQVMIIEASKKKESRAFGEKRSNNKFASFLTLSSMKPSNKESKASKSTAESSTGNCHRKVFTAKPSNIGAKFEDSSCSNTMQKDFFTEHNINSADFSFVTISTTRSSDEEHSESGYLAERPNHDGSKYRDFFEEQGINTAEFSLVTISTIRSSEEQTRSDFSFRTISRNRSSDGEHTDSEYPAQRSPDTSRHEHTDSGGFSLTPRSPMMSSVGESDYPAAGPTKSFEFKLVDEGNESMRKRESESPKFWGPGNSSKFNIYI